MKILHVIIDLDVGGAELMLKRLTHDHSQRFSSEHIIVSLTDVGRVGQQMAEAGFQVISLGMTGVLSALFALVRLIRLIRLLRPNIVQTWMYHADLIGGISARLAGVNQVIWGIRSTDISQGGSKTTLIIRMICAKISDWIPSAIVCAAKVSKDIHIAVGYSPSKMLVIPNGFDLKNLIATESQREEIRISCGIRNNDLVIGSIGRFNPVKDHSLFISAAGRLLAKHTNIKFLLVGRELHSQNSKLMALINATPQPYAFKLLGERSDIAACLKAMDIFCLHSRTEGFPNVLGEAMAIGLPCITTDVGDAAFLLDRHGLVIPSRDAAALTDALEKMLACGLSKLEEIGAAGQIRISKEFSMEIMTENYHRLYIRLLGHESA